MYILLITRGYPSEKYPLNGIFEFDQARALIEAGHKIIYAAVDLRSIRRTRKFGFESFEKEGIQIEAVNIPCGRLPRNILNKIGIIALRKLYERIEKKYGQPDVIHAHFIDCGYFSAHLYTKSKVPIVLTEHFSGMNQKVINPYLTKLGNYTYKRMDKVIAVSKHLANNLQDKFGISVMTIPNIVDTSSFKYIYSKTEKNDFSFISTGSLTQNKRMDILIESYYKAFGESKNVKLYIYGDGPERKNLENIIKRYSLEDNVLLMGLSRRSEIAEKMKNCDCFVLVSELETFGVAYIEAMAMGLPVIATRCGGPEDFVTEENGVLIPVNDTNALTTALKMVYKNINYYNRKVISDLTKKRFKSSTIASELLDAYGSILIRK